MQFHYKQHSSVFLALSIHCFPETESTKMVGCRLLIKNKKTDWLSTLLCSKFFGSCVNHPDLRKNEKNVFCIDCNLGFCRHCIKPHCLHRRLQICKYVYHDVVRLQDFQKYFDCSKIQTYKINGEKAVHLNPRPQPKDSRPSTKSKNGGSCEACGRYIQDLPNRFCSIACKVSILSEKPKEENHEIIAFPVEEFDDLSFKNNCIPETYTDEKEWYVSPAESSEDNYSESYAYAWESPALKPRRQSHKRKGVPRRSPLC